jgi:recombination protein RecT
MAAKTKDLMEIKKETADLVLAKVQHFQNNKELDLPPNYSAANALKAAWLILQDTQDKDKRPVLEVCTKHSVANCLLDMVIQGLNPAKKQAYFIAYGKSLTLQRSYFGTKAVALRVCPDLADIFAEVIYVGDEVEISINKGQKTVVSHTTKFSNIDDGKIHGAYATAIDKDGNAVRTEIMSMEQLKNAWAQSRMRPVQDNGDLNPKSTHAKFTGEMAKKTVTSRLAKHFINSSDDSDLVVQSVRRTDDEAVEAEAYDEIEENANAEIIDIEASEKSEVVGEDPPDEPSEDEQQEIIQQEMAEAEAEERQQEQESARRGPSF